MPTQRGARGRVQQPNPWSRAIRPAVKRHTISAEGKSVGVCPQHTCMSYWVVRSEMQQQTEHISSTWPLNLIDPTWFCTLTEYQMTGPQRWKPKKTPHCELATKLGPHLCLFRINLFVAFLSKGAAARDITLQFPHTHSLLRHRCFSLTFFPIACRLKDVRVCSH